MDNYCAEYSGKNLRYSEEGVELRINTSDLCSILGVDPPGPNTLDMASAVQLALAFDSACAKWLLETFDDHAPADLKGNQAWLYNQIRSQLREDDS